MGVAYVSRGPQSARISMHQRKSHLDGCAASNITPATWRRIRQPTGGISYNAYRAEKEHCAWYERRGYEVNRMPTHLSKNPR